MSTNLQPRSMHQPMAKAAGHGKAAAVVAEREGRRMFQIPVEGCDPTGVPDW